ncbi:MAG: hypothetical protein ACREBC_35780, partial [Pyrinomonadaceae bacterium]
RPRFNCAQQGEPGFLALENLGLRLFMKGDWNQRIVQAPCSHLRVLWAVSDLPISGWSHACLGPRISVPRSYFVLRHGQQAV